MIEKELSKILERLEIPKLMGHFMLPNEVNERCSDLMRVDGVLVSVIGVSRSRKYPIHGIAVGASENEAEKIIVVCANMHAEEVTGTISTMLLAEELALNPDFKPLLKNRFLFVPQANPDGVMLNKGWMKPNFNYKDFLLNYYRDLPKDDVEWGFPVEGKKIYRPESRAVMNFLSRQSRIDHYVSLHSGFLIGGPHFLIAGEKSRQRTIIEFLTELILTIKEDVDLYDEDPAGMMGCERIDKGFFSIPDYEYIKKYIEQSGNKKLLNDILMTSVQYVQQRFNPKFSMVSEIPFVWDNALNGLEYVGLSRYDIEKQMIEYDKINISNFEKGITEIAGLKIDGEAKLWFDWARNWYEFRKTSLLSYKKEIEKLKGKKATRKDLLEVYLRKFVAEYLPASFLIKILRHCEGQAANNLFFKYQDIFDEAYAKYEERLNLQVLPLETQVKLQIGMILSGLLL